MAVIENAMTNINYSGFHIRSSIYKEFSSNTSYK